MRVKVVVAVLSAVLFATGSRVSKGGDVKKDPVQVAPQNYRVVFENDRVRVLAFRGKPGEKWGLHEHPDAVVVSLSDYRVRNVVPDSEPTYRDAKRGDVAWIPARSHTGENVGTTEMECVLVELKEPKP